MSNKKYIGLTIGPVLKTLNGVRHTRELWAASYIFSYIMKRIILKWKDKHKFIMPYVKSDDLFDDKDKFYGAGLFPDRFIFEVEEGKDDLKELNKTINEVLDSISGMIHADINKSEFPLDDVKSFVKSYFQIYTCEVDVKQNAILEVNNVLDILELQNQFVLEDKKSFLKGAAKKKKYFNPLEYYLDSIDISIKKMAFADRENLGLFKDLEGFKKGKGFPSIGDISTLEIAQKETAIWSEAKKAEKVEEVELIDHLKKLLKISQKEDTFKFRNKYICIVQADGDNIGKTIKVLGQKQKEEDENLSDFSEALFEFGKKSAKLISDFGGKPVYIGGDDLLFFAPVVTWDENTDTHRSIFDLFVKLDEVFDDSLKKIVDPIKSDLKALPSLSYGLSISYHKFPLYEALKEGQHLLFNKAKNFNDKNATAFRLLKHSGQYFGTIYGKKSESFKILRELLDHQLNNERMLSTMMYKLNDAAVLIKAMRGRPKSVQAFFENFFNEAIHKTPKGRDFIKLVSALVVAAFEEYVSYDRTKKEEEDKEGDAKYKKRIEKEEKNAMECIYSSLRMAQFINQEDSNSR